MAPGTAVTVVRRARPYIPQRIIAMAADTRRRGGNVIAGLVAIRARQRAMQANHVAAYPRVIEARWGK